jgi:hypothetical protein
MSEQRKPRNDYRTESPYTLRGFLVNAYPSGLDYATSITSRHTQLHETARHKGVYVHLDGAGKPDLTTRFVDELCGVPHVTFRKAIERAEEIDPVAVKVLRWHQKAHCKESRYKFAFDLGVTDRQLTRMLSRAVEMVRESLPEEARFLVNGVERQAQAA